MTDSRDIVTIVNDHARISPGAHAALERRVDEQTRTIERISAARDDLDRRRIESEKCGAEFLDTIHRHEATIAELRANISTLVDEREALERRLASTAEDARRHREWLAILDLDHHDDSDAVGMFQEWRAQGYSGAPSHAHDCKCGACSTARAEPPSEHVPMCRPDEAHEIVELHTLDGHFQVVLDEHGWTPEQHGSVRCGWSTSREAGVSGTAGISSAESSRDKAMFRAGYFHGKFDQYDRYPPAHTLAMGTLRDLLSRSIKYAREDRMRTPGFTRLARVLAEAEAALIDTPTDPAPAGETEHLHAAQLAAREHVTPHIHKAAAIAMAGGDTDTAVVYTFIANLCDGAFDSPLIRYARALIRLTEGAR